MLTVQALGALERPGKLFQDLLDINKKYKLGYKAPTADEVKQWVEKAKEATAGNPEE